MQVRSPRRILCISKPEHCVSWLRITPDAVTESFITREVLKLAAFGHADFGDLANGGFKENCHYQNHHDETDLIPHEMGIRGCELTRSMNELKVM